MDRVTEGRQDHDWWPSLEPDRKAALNLLFAQNPGRLKKQGLPVTDEDLANITMQLASYSGKGTLMLGGKCFKSPQELADHIRKKHTGIKTGRTFPEF